jgi:hypothetical protein
MTRRGESKRNPVMLSAAKHLDAHPDRPFAAAQGDTVRQLRLMRITADLSALAGFSTPQVNKLISINSPGQTRYNTDTAYREEPISDDESLSFKPTERE